MSGVSFLEASSTDLVAVDGIAILGDTDPNAYGIASDPRNDLADAEFPARCERLAERFLSGAARIVLVHDRRLGECAADAARESGRTLVFIYGHDHKPFLGVDRGVLELDPGTSGANGIKTPTNAPYGFGLLEFDPANGDLFSACLFSFDDPAHLRETTCRIEPFAPPEELQPG
jgi:predicted phosphodiesterase